MNGNWTAVDMLIKELIIGIYYSIRNVLLYRYPRELQQPQLDKLKRIQKENVRKYITTLVLNSLGLDLVGVEITRFIYITKKQREVINMVKAEGFEVYLK